MITLLARKMSYEDPDAANSDSSDATSGETLSNEAVTAELAPLADATAKELVQIFKLLADETRLRILYFLMQQEELNVRTLCELLNQSQPAVSHHLALLRVAGMIECRRDGKHNFYRIVPKRCQAYLDMLFAASPQQQRRIRIEDSVLTYARDGQLGA